MLKNIISKYGSSVYLYILLLRSLLSVSTCFISFSICFACFSNNERLHEISGIIFDMPSHRKFLESIGFKKYSNYGWRVLNNHLNEINTKQLKKEYLYPGLDQYELYDELIDLPEEELKKVTKDQLQYPWVLRNVIKNRA